MDGWMGEGKGREPAPAVPPHIVQTLAEQRAQVGTAAGNVGNAQVCDLLAPADVQLLQSFAALTAQI